MCHAYIYAACINTLAFLLCCVSCSKSTRELSILAPPTMSLASLWLPLLAGVQADPAAGQAADAPATGQAADAAIGQGMDTGQHHPAAGQGSEDSTSRRSAGSISSSSFTSQQSDEDVRGCTAGGQKEDGQQWDGCAAGRQREDSRPEVFQ